MSILKEKALNVIFGEDKFYKGNTIFHLIAESHCLEILDRIWDSSKDNELQRVLQLKNDHGETCLHLAVKYSSGIDAERIVAQMFDMGADLDAQEDGTGNTILHMAVKQKDYELVEYLLKVPTKTNIKNEDGLTPYQLAEQDNDPKMMELFTRE